MLKYMFLFQCTYLLHKDSYGGTQRNGEFTPAATGHGTSFLYRSFGSYKYLNNPTQSKKCEKKVFRNLTGNFNFATFFHLLLSIFSFCTAFCVFFATSLDGRE